MSRKVPVVMQMEALECGAACLCMIAAYYGKWIGLPVARKDCGVSRDGSIARNMLTAARSYGFDAAGYKVEPSDIGEMTLPAIVHWNFNHYVVVTKIDYKRKKVYLNDPAKGRVVVSMETFDNSFTGILLSIVPNEKFKPEGKPRGIVSFVKKCLKNSFFPFLLASLISMSLGVINLIYPLFDRFFIDNILGNQNYIWLDWFLIATFGTLILNVFIGIIQSVHWLKIEGKFSIVSGAKFMWHSLRLPLEFFSQRYIGDIVSRQGSAARISLVLIKKIAPIFMDFFSLIFYLFFMINYSWQLSIIGILSILLNIFIVKYSSKRLVEIQNEAAPNSGKLMSVTYSAVEMIETIKSTGAENGFFERWAGFYTKSNNADVKLMKFRQYIGNIPGAVHALTSLILKILGIYLIMDGKFTIGMLTAFEGFVSGFRQPIDNSLDVYQSFLEVKNEIERVEDVLDYKLDVSVSSDQKKVSSDPLKGSLEFRNVTFGYSPLAEPIIKNFSFKLDPGKWIALVGPSGCGKSTLSKLIMGLYQPWSGEILFDGKRRSEIDPYTFHKYVSMVDQEKILFNDSVSNNIKMWDDSIEDFSVILSSKDADIHNTIVSRPEGYNHVIAEGGKDFSGGQCQRIEIARALAVEPVLLVLDEATSALDASTEVRIINNIRRLACSCVVVAHRLSSIRDCDQIIVLDKGEIVETGSHDELMNLNGFYSKLVTVE